MNRIEHLDNGIKAIQRDVIRHMENKLNELKSSLISSIENLNHKSIYANAVTRPGSTQMIEQPSVEVCQNNLDSCYIDEGYEDQSGTSVQRPSSQTRPKTVFTPDSGYRRQQPATTTMVQPPQQVTPPQHVPSRVTNRNQSQPRQRVRENIQGPSNMSAASSSQGGQNRNRTLLIGDSILKGINY